MSEGCSLRIFPGGVSGLVRHEVWEMPDCTELGGRFGYFLFFSARAGGRGSPRCRDGGGAIDSLLKIQGGGSSGREGLMGPEGCLW